MLPVLLLALASLQAAPPAPAVAEAIVPQAAARAEEPILVLAPSSLTDVLPRIARAWRAEGGPPVRFSFDATSRLATQVGRGAPADLLVSADRRWMAWVLERGAVAGAVVDDLLRSRLVLVVPADRGRIEARRTEGLQALRGPHLERLALADPEVPAGRYARRALEAAGLWEDVSARVVRGGSVRGVLEWVARGEVDAGVVYAPDARVEPRVRVVHSFDAAGDPEVVYTAAVPAARADGRSAGAAFLDFLAGERAAAIFREAGFEPGAAERVTALEGGAVAGSGSDAPTASGHPDRAGVPDPAAAIRLSLLVGALAAILGLVPAVGAGWLLARRTFPGKAVLSTLLLIPLVLPPVVTGFLLLALLGREGPLGGLLAALGAPVPFTPLAPVIAAVVVGFPLYVVAARGAFEAVDPRYEEVSWTLGRPPARTFFRIALPLALPGVVAGAVLAFARALGEFGATIVLAGNVEGVTRTIPLAVFSLLESPGGERAMWILVGASVALSFVALLGYEALSRRQRRRLEDPHGR